MATKNGKKTFDYYYDKLSKKLVDKRFFYYLNPGAGFDDRVFYDEETFLLAILNELYAHVSGEENIMFYILSNPTTYSLMLFNKYLKEQGKMDEANEILDSLFKLELDIIPLRSLKERYDKEELMKAYNDGVNSLIKIEAKLNDLSKGFSSHFKKEKEKGKKDGYIG
jgi:hypothetical protein